MPSHADTTFILKCDKNTLFVYDQDDKKLSLYDLEKKSSKTKVLTTLLNNLESFKAFCKQTEQVGKKLVVDTVEVFDKTYIKNLKTCFKQLNISLTDCSNWNGEYMFTLSAPIVLGDKNFVEPIFPQDVLNIVKKYVDIEKLGFCTPIGNFDERYYDNHIFPAFKGVFKPVIFDTKTKYFSKADIKNKKLQFDELDSFLENLEKLGIKTLVKSCGVSNFFIIGYFDTKPEKIFSFLEKCEIDFETAVYSRFHKSYISQYIEVDLTRCKTPFGISIFKKDYLSTIDKTRLYNSKRILDYVKTVNGVNYLMSTVGQYVVTI